MAKQICAVLAHGGDDSLVDFSASVHSKWFYESVVNHSKGAIRQGVEGCGVGRRFFDSGGSDFAQRCGSCVA